MRPLLFSTLALGLASAVAAQTTQVLPASAATTEGNSNNIYPWGTTTIRVQHCYDSSHIPAPGPIIIQRLRIRADGGTNTWAGGTFTNATVTMSTATADYSALSTTFAANHGKDMTKVYSGNITVKPNGPSGTPRPNYYIDVPFQNNFLYDPAGGDLLIDVQINGLTGTTFRSDACSGSAYKCSRVYNTGSATATTGTFGNNYGIVCAIDYIPAQGLYTNFDATPRQGKSPLKVQFTDKTFTSDKGGVTSWAWDFDGDNKIDSTVPNPTWTFTGTGYDNKFSITLTTTDATHKPSTLTKKDFIVVNPFPVAMTEDFGAGSTNTPIPAPIGLPPHSSTYSAAATRGFYFQVPTTIVITGFNVPNDYTTPQTHQSVWLIAFKSKPSGATTITANETLFFSTNNPVTSKITPPKPIIVQKDTWIGVLGACHMLNNTTMRNSYGAGSYKTTVVGMPIELNRLYYQSALVGSNGTGTVYPSTGSLARVEVYVVGNTIVPTLLAEGQPYFGNSTKLTMAANIPGAQAGVLFMSLAKLATPVTTPFGDLLLAPPFPLVLSVPNGNGSATIPIPNDKAFADVNLFWQGAVFDLTNATYGMTNGNHWLIGQK